MTTHPHLKSALAGLPLTVLSATTSLAQNPGEQRRDIPVSSSLRDSIVRAVAAAVRANYVDSTAGQNMGAAIDRRHVAGEYARYDSAAALVAALTAHLQEVRSDKHLRVDYFVVPRPMRVSAGSAGSEDLSARRAVASRRGYGIERVERLPGNVALVAIRSFEPIAIGGAALEAAMLLSEGADALLIDLRMNGGGYGEMVGALTSYFLPAGTRTTDYFHRPSGRTEREVVPASSHGPRFAGIPLYIVTSRQTFSAAEGFTYALKSRGVATVIGETTRGGANPVQPFQLHPHFVVFIPTGRVTDVVTGTNREGVGIQADVPADPSSAVNTAYASALQRLLATEKDADKADEIRAALRRLQGRAP